MRRNRTVDGRKSGEAAFAAAYFGGQIGLLQEQSLLLNEPEFYQLTPFDGVTIRIQEGRVWQI